MNRSTFGHGFFERWDSTSLSRLGSIDSADASQVLYFSGDTLYSILVGEGRYSEAEKSWQQLRELQRRVFGPEDVQTAVSTYNLACVAAHEGKRDEAFSLLREAIDHGIPPSLDLGIENDSDLQSLHGDPRFDAIVAHAKERAAAAAKQQ